nr:uncharacterized protein LOC103421629 [Malus domestica]
MRPQLSERRHRAKPLLPDDPDSQIINANLSTCFKWCHFSRTYRHVAAGCTPADTCPNPSRPRRKHDKSEDRVVAGPVRPVHCGEVADCEVEVSKVADEVRSLSNLLGFLGSIGWQHICNSVQVFGFELYIE